MAFQRRVVKLLTDEKCKFTHIRLADCPTTLQVGPELLTHKLPSTSVFTPDSTKVHVVKCPHPGTPPTDDDDIPNFEPVPEWLYVAYDRATNGGRIYRHAYTPPGTFGSAELIVQLPTSREVFHMVVDSERNKIIAYVIDNNTTESYLQIFNATTGDLQFTQARGGSSGLGTIQSLAIARNSQLVAYSTSPDTNAWIVVKDYAWNTVYSGIGFRPAWKIVGIAFNREETKLRWMHYRSLAFVDDEERLYESDVNGSNEELLISNFSNIISFSGEQHIQRLDGRSSVNKGFIFDPGDDVIMEYTFNNPGSLGDVIQLSQSAQGKAFDLNYIEQKLTYPFIRTVSWADYDGQNSEVIVDLDPSPPGSPEVRAVAWGY